jgi:flagellar motor switch protein FliG
MFEDPADKEATLNDIQPALFDINDNIVMLNESLQELTRELNSSSWQRLVKGKFKNIERALVFIGSIIGAWYFFQFVKLFG